MKTNKELGAVYLEVKGLDKERFKELTKGMDFYGFEGAFEFDYIENRLNMDGTKIQFIGVAVSNKNAKLITIDELEQLLKTETTIKPTHFAISPEEYEEWQEFKNRKREIDYSRLKTGSVVKIKHTGNHCHGINNINLDTPVTILLYKQNGFVTNDGYNKSNREYVTFIQENKLCHFTAYEIDYITEVISY